MEDKNPADFFRQGHAESILMLCVVCQVARENREGAWWCEKTAKGCPISSRILR